MLSTISMIERESESSRSVKEGRKEGAWMQMTVRVNLRKQGEWQGLEVLGRKMNNEGVR
jgi:hypothetical protein